MDCCLAWGEGGGVENVCMASLKAGHQTYVCVCVLSESPVQDNPGFGCFSPFGYAKYPLSLPV